MQYDRNRNGEEGIEVVIGTLHPFCSFFCKTKTSLKNKVYSFKKVK